MPRLLFSACSKLGREPVAYCFSTCSKLAPAALRTVELRAKTIGSGVAGVVQNLCVRVLWLVKLCAKNGSGEGLDKGVEG